MTIQGVWIAEESDEIVGSAFSWVCGDLWFLAELLAKRQTNPPTFCVAPHLSAYTFPASDPACNASNLNLAFEWQSTETELCC